MKVRFKDFAGKERLVDLSPFKVDWSAKCLSKFQTNVKKFFHPYWKQHLLFEEVPLVGTKLRFDFLNMSLRIALEVQGAQHLSYNSFFHKNSEDFEKQLERDAVKSIFCKKNHLKLVQIFPEDMPLTIERVKVLGINLTNR